MYKVVIIDDEPWTRGVIKNLADWKQYDMEVVGEAADGETGLELIHKVSPDLVITDVRMPRLNGIDLVALLRKENNRVPVIIISGYDDFSYVRSALQLEVADYILKPIKQKELNEQLERCNALLKAKKSTQKTSIVQVGFLADGWEEQYNSLQRDIYSALQQSNKELLQKLFNKLLSAVIDHDGSTPSQAIQIGLYYSLIYPLQKHIETMGLTKESVFTDGKTTFVFSRDNTLKQMFDFIFNMYTLAIEQIYTQHTLAHLDIDAVCRYVIENYLHGVTLEHTADVFHVTKEYLSKAFKASQNMCFTKYVIALKMNKAKELIEADSIPLKDIGAIIGYYDQAQFYKSFKQYFGKTPGEMRKRLNIDNQ